MRSKSSSLRGRSRKPIKLIEIEHQKWTRKLKKRSIKLSKRMISYFFSIKIISNCSEINTSGRCRYTKRTKSGPK